MSNGDSISNIAKRVAKTAHAFVRFLHRRDAIAKRRKQLVDSIVVQENTKQAQQVRKDITSEFFSK